MLTTCLSTEPTAVLVLEDGRRFAGQAYGARGRTLGEIVFATGMTGYQETLTDPSYVGQIVVQTAPHIGNTGTNDDDMESRRMWVAGYVVRDPSRVVSNFRAQRSLDDDLASDGIVGISAVDTRAITRHIRSAGSMRAGVFSGEDFALSEQQQLALVRGGARMAGLNLSADVSTPEQYTVPVQGERVGSVAVIDLGVKTSTVNYLAERGFEVHVLPESVTAEEVLALTPSALFFSNGPGDPEASDRHVELLRTTLRAGLPFFGICFGNQLLGRALGFGTYKLPFGHRGINQPVLDKLTGRVEITAQNHGFAVDAPIDGELDSPYGFGRVEVSHYSLNDSVVEGLRCLDIPAFSVQYHPEAAAGPHDSTYLFDRFRAMVVQRTAEQSGSTSAPADTASPLILQTGEQK
ncbi:glutamine-hydrolyzing carbamoyl-phosphate synthase small subunit [Rathayibacter toxicus]|uniref:glutamine-hydrolyzing carbamoyl-phosphate synthase small subunit n=1 Tax=Rathayibacter toxicus TaxID=145458 RepID=UPI000CE82441|nr:glutamine-hydrolyzing carbamoyl-phosphate synthase small subunit [Rathayibacter toxicus]PPI55428.1 carbamoyl phosphate synthase small subunit [Rathayibacter toxicus]QOD11240.1 glutamine-hydrolyzing carbamoyl-phosphate synthase small subunit [Rathayibacter toxicus]QWL27983.1 carbamoyl-phosphate synthase small subunit [Rathayibacter toxicus]QWL32181.1 carbamoyl-phosphate synthase small subunit [Rathayibacter toxicus]QWL34274.1 carbamoyl-phosphate synthase small subunit [Rathayibacter toxicus]